MIHHEMIEHNIRVYHTGRIAHTVPERTQGGMMWSRDMRFFFTQVPAGHYTLDLLMKETTRVDAGATNSEQPAVNVYHGNRLVAERVAVKTESVDDPFTEVSIPITVAGTGFDVRIAGVQGGVSLP